MKIFISDSDKRTVLFLLFSIFVFITRYRWATNIGYAVLGIELVVVVGLWFNRNNDVNIGGPIATFIIYALFTVINGAVKVGMGSVKRLVYINFGLCVFLLVLINKETLIKLLLQIRNLGILLSFFGCVEYAIKDSFFIRLIEVKTRIMAVGTLGTNRFRVRTIFLQPMPCATMEVFFWILVLCLPYKNRFLNFIAKCLILVCLIGTQARSSWIIFFLITMIFMIKSGKYVHEISRTYLRVLPALIVLIIAGIMINLETISDMLEIIVDRWRLGLNVGGASYHNRAVEVARSVFIWKEYGFLDKLFGKGNGFLLTYLRLHPIRGYFAAVDMQYAAVLTDNGIFALILLAVIVIQTGMVLLKEKNLYILACALGSLNILMSGFFYEIFDWISIMIIFCVCLKGMSYSRRNG